MTTDVQEEWKDPNRTPIDFILVGAGAGGAPLAARLAERGYVVLVVEMGPEKPPRPATAVVENTEVPLTHSETTEDARHSLRFFVQHFDKDPAESLDPKVHEVSDLSSDDNGIFYPRAQGVGGCTVHNAMITVSGRSEDWDEIAEATGDESWRGERMRPYFQRLERCHYARPSTLLGKLKAMLGFPTGWENSRHGERGWLDTTLSSLAFLGADWKLLHVVLGGAFAALRACVVGFGDLLRAALTGRTFPALDPNHWETMRQGGEGISRIPCAITPTGERSGPRKRLLDVKADPAHGKRLHLLTGAFVTEIVLDKDPAPALVGGKEARHRAKGVVCLSQENVYEACANHKPAGSDWTAQTFKVYCKREVLLCGGSFNTPQLLMLSGIGPAEHLAHPDIQVPCRVNLPGVGQNLQDRYEVPVVAKVKGGFRSLAEIRLNSTDLDPQLRRWVDNAGRPAVRRGLYATNGGLIAILYRTKQEDNAPDLFIFALAGRFPGYKVGWARPEELLGLPKDQILTGPRQALTWVILKSRTNNHGGEVLLRSNSPFRRPLINFRSFGHAGDDDTLNPVDGVYPESSDKDLEALNEGVEFVQSILQHDKGTTIESFELPGFEGNPDFNGNVRKWIKHVAWGHHACGTCRMGADDDDNAVLDSRFRVRGVKGLRVVDASVFPRIPGFFVVANVYMASEKAADVLTEDNPLLPEKVDPESKAALKLDPVLPSSAIAEARRVYPAEMEEAEAQLIAKRREAAFNKQHQQQQ
jgi:choline dehydrogenase